MTTLRVANRRTAFTPEKRLPLR